jgi:eukaryotic-like serine/threonine-protein kinase
VTHIPDDAVTHLRELVEHPDTSGSRYTVVRRIGEGGMGAVYLAHDSALDREVALKVLRLPDPSEEELALIMREARVLAKLEHPGIVPVHDVGRLDDGRVYYVMKHIRGQRLDEFAREDTHPRAELLRVFRQVCEAVAFAHANGVLHRDLKPQNVMIGAFGEVLVLDWGVATTMRDREAIAGPVMGTPGYMSPEQLAGAAALDERADVFGLGGLLQYLLSGAHPGSAAAQRGTVPAPLWAICERARAPRAEDRYDNATQLAADIGNYLDALPVSAHRESLAERAWRVAVRHKTPILLVLAYLAMRIILLLVG